MSKNTRENPHRKLYTAKQISELERYHDARRAYPLGGHEVSFEYAPSRITMLGGDDGAAAIMALAALALGRKSKRAA